MLIWTFQDRLERTWEIRTEIRSGIRTEIRISKRQKSHKIRSAGCRG